MRNLGNMLRRYALGVLAAGVFSTGASGLDLIVAQGNDSDPSDGAVGTIEEGIAYANLHGNVNLLLEPGIFQSSEINVSYWPLEIIGSGTANTQLNAVIVGLDTMDISQLSSEGAAVYNAGAHEYEGGSFIFLKGCSLNDCDITNIGHVSVDPSDGFTMNNVVFHDFTNTYANAAFYFRNPTGKKEEMSKVAYSPVKVRNSRWERVYTGILITREA